jgi:2Fe-2S ferredoxin
MAHQMATAVVTVHVEPSGFDVEVAEGQSVMAGAERQGLFWPTICHGLAQCHTCFFEVIAGEENLEPPNALETNALKEFSGRSWYEGKVIRLACQTRVRGGVTVRKPGVRPAS